MISLIIDCSLGMSLYLIDENNVVSYVDLDEKKHTDFLLTNLDKLLVGQNKKVCDIDNFCVCTGPGSFTGIRVAISICKGLAVESKAKVYCLSNLDLFDFVNKSKALYLLDGFSQFVYARKFENGKSEDLCLSFDDVKALQNGGFDCYVLFDSTKEKLNAHQILAEKVDCKIIDAFKQKIANDEFVFMNQIEPIYLRASQAEIERNKKLEENKNANH